MTRSRSTGSIDYGRRFRTCAVTALNSGSRKSSCGSRQSKAPEFVVYLLQSSMFENKAAYSPAVTATEWYKKSTLGCFVLFFRK
jgi:hypothetical protein